MNEEINRVLTAVAAVLIITALSVFYSWQIAKGAFINDCMAEHDRPACELMWLGE